jgi:predicted Fe-S protein YdhL (DUF1289 family)
MEVLSPCIKKCSFLPLHDGSFICEGCRRTLDEITNWSKYTDQQQKEIIDRLKEQ